MRNDVKDEKIISMTKDSLNFDSSIGSLYLEMGPKIKMFLMKKGFSSENSEDIVQDTFIKVIKNLDKYKENNKLSSWVYKIAINQGIDYFRKNKIDYIEDNSELENILKDSFPSPEEEMMKKEKHQQIRENVEELDSLKNQIIKRRYWEDLSYKEISEKMELPMGTVKGLLYRAHNSLLEKIN